MRNSTESDLGLFCQSLPGTLGLPSAGHGRMGQELDGGSVHRPCSAALAPGPRGARAAVLPTRGGLVLRALTARGPLRADACGQLQFVSWLQLDNSNYVPI